MDKKGNDLIVHVTACFHWVKQVTAQHKTQHKVSLCLQYVCANLLCMCMCISPPLLSLLPVCANVAERTILPNGRRCLSGEPQPRLQPVCQFCVLATQIHTHKHMQAYVYALFIQARRNKKNKNVAQWGCVNK